jgi:hypothetical protein
MKAADRGPFALRDLARAKRTNRTILFPKVLVGLFVAVGAMAGIYALAATTATTAAAGFVDTETESRARILEFAHAVKRASADFDKAQARCERIPDAKRHLCNIDARAEETRAKMQALLNYEEGFRRVGFGEMGKTRVHPADAVVDAVFDLGPIRVH